MNVAELLVKIGAVSDAKQVNKVLNGIKASANKMAAGLSKSMSKAFGKVSGMLNTKDAMQGLSGLQKSMKSLTGMMGLNLGANLLQMLAPDAISEAQKKIKEFFDTIIKNSPGIKELGKIIKTLMNSVMDLLKKLRPYIERTIKTAVNMLQRVTTFVQRLIRPIRDLIDRFGGMDTVMRALLVTAGLLFAVMNFDKIVTAISMIMKLLSPMTLVLISIALIVEDFISFMQGKESFFGDVFEEMGIGADEAREGIKEFFGTIKDDLIPIIKEVSSGTLKGFLAMIKNVIRAIVTFATENKDLISNVLEKLPGLIGGIINVAVQLAGFIMTTGLQIFQFLLEKFDALEPFLSWLFNTALPGILDGASQLIDPLLNLLDTILQPIIDLVTDESFLQSLEDLGGPLLENIKTVLDGVGQFLKPIVEAITDLIRNLLPKLKPLFEALQPVLEAVGTAFGVIGQALGVVIGWIEKLLGWGIEGLTNLFGALKGAADSGSVISGGGGMGGDSGYGEMGEGYTGIGTFYATGTDDADETFLAGEHGTELITGQKGKKVFSALATNKINEALKMVATMAQPAQPVVNNSGRNVNQTVNITNNFSGGRDAQTAGAAAMDKSARSATDYMAHALNFGRV